MTLLDDYLETLEYLDEEGNEVVDFPDESDEDGEETEDAPSPSL